MTHRRRRMQPFVLLMSVATTLVYASAGGGVVDRAPALVAADLESPAQVVTDQVVPQAPIAPDSETSVPVPPDAEPEDAGAVAALPQTEGEGGEVTADNVHPVRVRIPDIAVDAAVVDLGLADDGTLEVPTDFGNAGWYTGRSVPGDVGPSVVVGHVDSHTGAAVFFELSQLEVGDLIQIDRSDGLVAWFQIRELALVDKGEFPTQEVYADTAEPTLRLITCGGDFDHSERSYLGNLIVFADHLGNSTTGVSTEEPNQSPAEMATSGTMTRA